jgi:hypothetical protein
MNTSDVYEALKKKYEESQAENASKSKEIIRLQGIIDKMKSEPPEPPKLTLKMPKFPRQPI